jgi:hypothetical protein
MYPDKRLCTNHQKQKNPTKLVSTLNCTIHTLNNQHELHKETEKYQKLENYAGCLANTSNAKKKTGPEAANGTLLIPYSSSSSKNPKIKH